MISEKEKYEALGQVLKSQAFSKTTTASVLLKLLVEATINQKVLSAFEIGLELFGKNFDQEKIEVNTRVNIYHLRKKLQKYYEGEGKEDLFSISIKPGQYKVSFTSRKELSQGLLKMKIGFGVATLLLVTIALVFNRNVNPKTIWTPLMNNNHVTTLYLGEVFGYTGPTQFSERGWIRDFHLNSEEDFYNEIRRNPDKYANYAPADYSYVVFENAQIIKPFTQFFYKNKHPFSISRTAEFNMSLLREQNTVYAGPLFVNSPFVVLFNNFSKNITLQPLNVALKHYRIQYVNPKKGIDTIISFKAQPDSEYTLTAGFIGPNNTMHYMFFSNHGMGLNAVVEFLFNDQNLKEFGELVPKDSDEFVALFHVRGKDRTSFEIELVMIDDNR